MRKISKELKRWHENNIDTLGTLFGYSTTKYSKNKQSQVIDGELYYTYGSFKQKCESISNQLSQYGIGAGDKVAILAHNTPNWTVAFFACVPFGRIVVPILVDSSEHEVTNILQHSESKVLFSPGNSSTNSLRRLYPGCVWWWILILLRLYKLMMRC